MRLSLRSALLASIGSLLQPIVLAQSTSTTSLCTPAPTPTACAYSFPTTTCISNSQGCFLDDNSAGYTLQSCGQTRRFSVHIPNGYNPATSSPLVFSFHGRGQNSRDQFNLTELYRPSFNTHAWLSVYPQGLRGDNQEPAWQGASYASSGVNDTQFTADLLAALQPCFKLNNSRIYAAGKSNGGGFVDTLACSTAGAKFAAFSAHSGAFYTDVASDPYADCPYNNRSTRPFIEFHGGSDPTIPYAGNATRPNGAIPPTPQVLDRWGQRNGCSPGSGKSAFAADYPANAVNVTTYDCGPNKAAVVQGYWIRGLPHWWASTHPNIDNGGQTTFINATPYFVDFLGRWSLPA